VHRGRTIEPTEYTGSLQAEEIQEARQWSTDDLFNKPHLLRYSHAVAVALPSTQDDGSSETADVVGLVGQSEVYD